MSSSYLGKLESRRNTISKPLSFYGGVFRPQFKAHYRMNPIEQEYQLRKGSDSLKFWQNGNFCPKHLMFWACPVEILARGSEAEGKMQPVHLKLSEGAKTPPPHCYRSEDGAKISSRPLKKQSQVVSYVIMFP